MFDPWRNQSSVQFLEVGLLDSGTEMGLAFQDDVEFVRGTVVAPALFLSRLEADEVADQTRSVEHAQPVRLLAREAAELAEVDYLQAGPTGPRPGSLRPPGSLEEYQ